MPSQRPQHPCHFRRVLVGRRRRSNVPRAAQYRASCLGTRTKSGRATITIAARDSAIDATSSPKSSQVPQCRARNAYSMGKSPHITVVRVLGWATRRVAVSVLFGSTWHSGDCPNFRVSENGTAPFAAVYVAAVPSDTKIRTGPHSAPCRDATILGITKPPVVGTEPLPAAEGGHFRCSVLARMLDCHAHAQHQNVKITSKPPESCVLAVPSLKGCAVVPAKPSNQS
jgi:hypothetical protein